MNYFTPSTSLYLSWLVAVIDSDGVPVGSPSVIKLVDDDYEALRGFW